MEQYELRGKKTFYRKYEAKTHGSRGRRRSSAVLRDDGDGFVTAEANKEF
jgi:hypothetical protein